MDISVLLVFHFDRLYCRTSFPVLVIKGYRLNVLPLEKVRMNTNTDTNTHIEGAFTEAASYQALVNGKIVPFYNCQSRQQHNFPSQRLVI